MEVLAIVAVIIISVIGCDVCNTFFRESISGDCLLLFPGNRDWYVRANGVCRLPHSCAMANLDNRAFVYWLVCLPRFHDSRARCFQSEFSARQIHRTLIVMRLRNADHALCAVRSNQSRTPRSLDPV